MTSQTTSNKASKPRQFPQGEIPGPPTDSTLFRTNRYLPYMKKYSVSRAVHIRYCTVNDVNHAITAFVDAGRDPVVDSALGVSCHLAVIEDGKEETLMGKIRGRHVDTGPSDAEADLRQLFVEEILQTPPRYRGDKLTHSGEGDAMHDQQKIFQLLFDDSGDPKATLEAKLGELLAEHDEFLYIDTFNIQPEYRGKGLAEHAMEAFLAAVCKITDDMPVLLSPAPLFEETERMRREKRKVGGYCAIVAKLTGFYSKCGFKVAFQGNKRKAGSITVMIRADMEVDATDASDTILQTESQSRIQEPAQTLRQPLTAQSVSQQARRPKVSRREADNLQDFLEDPDHVVGEFSRQPVSYGKGGYPLRQNRERKS